jgi:type III secretory pathway component EscU
MAHVPSNVVVVKFSKPGLYSLQLLTEALLAPVFKGLLPAILKLVLLTVLCPVLAIGVLAQMHVAQG